MKLLIGGDVVPTSSNERYFTDGDIKTLFGKTCDLAKQADRVLINLECALTNSDNAIAKFGPNLKANPSCVKALKNYGVTDVMLSNNHTFDFGIAGLDETVKTLEREGINYTGIGENDTDSRKPYIIEKDGEKVGIIDVCEHEYSYALPDRKGTNPFDPFLTMQDIRELKKKTDYLIVIYHGGKEHCHYPSPRVYNLCREMVNNGADAVLTQHSHCIGCYEEFNGGHILHGQGNFCFYYKNVPESWYTGFLVELDTKNKSKIQLYPFVIGETGVSLAEGKDYDDIMSAFYARNEELKTGKWKDGWHEFCESKKEQYLKAFCSANEEEHEKFSHYLDCEAHTDVWKELFPTLNKTNERGKLSAKEK